MLASLTGTPDRLLSMRDIVRPVFAKSQFSHSHTIMALQKYGAPNGLINVHEMQGTFQVLKISYLTAVALSGMNSEQFRGLLVQGRQVADGSPVGTFINFGPNTQASQCTPPTVIAYAHTKSA